MLMFIQKSSLLGAVLLGHQVTTGRAQDTPRRWSESDVIERFLSQSTQARELRARVALTGSRGTDTRGLCEPLRGLFAGGRRLHRILPSFANGAVERTDRYLREAGVAAVSAADAHREAALWSLRADLRNALYRLLGSQERLRILASAGDDIAQLSRMLRQREDEGEGSRYDRLRAEREGAELRIDMTTARAAVAALRLDSPPFFRKVARCKSFRAI